MALLILRPPEACIPRQFLTESASSKCVGTVVMVLSQFCTLILLRLISITSPSAPYFGISIQSPTPIELVADTCTLATKPSIVHLKTTISIAEAAPKEAKNAQGELPVIIGDMIVPPINNRNTASTCK